MRRFLLLLAVFAAATVLAGSAMAAGIALKISGPGAVNDSTIKAGEKVSFDLYFENDTVFTLINVGFKITSPDIAAVTHVADSGKGRNVMGDVKAYNGFQDNSIFDMGGLHVVETDWDGKLPELIGFGALCVQNTYQPHPMQKNISMDMIFKTPGTVVVDSAFFPPRGVWMFAAPKVSPTWPGPYKFTVVE
ncbi:MAG: hypothetical protein AB1483_13380 [Candidatus Zixiibacteriota bacterium]